MSEAEWLDLIWHFLDDNFFTLTDQLASIAANVQTIKVMAMRVSFSAHVTAFAVSWIAGAFSFKLFLYAKNHRDIW